MSVRAGRLRLFPGRRTSRIAVASARNGSHYLEQQEQLGAPAQKSETVVELSYLAQISKSSPCSRTCNISSTQTRIRQSERARVLLRFEVSF